MSNFRFFQLRTISLLLALFCLTSTASAQSVDNKPVADTVTVKTTRNPVDKSYVRMIKGMDLFEKLHAMAPNASLRYKLLKRLPETEMTGITMKVVGDSIRIPVPIASDNTFTLERNAIAMKEDASVMPNRKAHSMTWRTDIRTPGLPANTRRLGDLRLECRVGFEAGLISEGIPILSTVATTIIKTLSEPCERSTGGYLLFADAPIFGVTLVYGDRRETLPVSWLYATSTEFSRSSFERSLFDYQSLIERTYVLPLGDHSWPNDTLIEYELMEDAQTAATAQQP